MITTIHATLYAGFSSRVTITSAITTLTSSKSNDQYQRPFATTTTANNVASCSKISRIEINRRPVRNLRIFFMLRDFPLARLRPPGDIKSLS